MEWWTSLVFCHVNTVSTCDQVKIMRIMVGVKKSMQFHGHFQTQNVPTTVLPMQLSAKHVWRSYTMFMYAAVSPACILCVCYAVIGCNTWTILCLKRENIYIRRDHEKLQALLKLLKLSNMATPQTFDCSLKILSVETMMDWLWPVKLEVETVGKHCGTNEAVWNKLKLIGTLLFCHQDPYS